MKDLISVIIPVYNVEKYLKECINSVLEQTYQKLEVILVDDGSTDSSSNICDEYALLDERIKVIHKINEGLSSARNAGLDIATGKYIGFVDSDDTISLDMYEKMYNKIVTDKSDACVCNCDRINNLGIKLDIDYSDLCEAQVNTVSGKAALNNIFYAKSSWRWITAWNKLYSSKIFDNLRFPMSKIHEDEYIIHNVFLNCKKVSIINDKLYHYRINESGIMSNINYNAYLDKSQALILRGKDCINLMDANWHRCNYLKINATIFAQKLGNDKSANDLKKKYKNSIHDYYFYILLLKRKKYISITEFLYLYLKIHFPWVMQKAINFSVKIKRKILFYLKWVRTDKKKYKDIFENIDFVLIDTPTHGNLGDHAIVLAQKQFLKTIFENVKFCEITAKEFDVYNKKFSRILPEDKPILVPGGGFLGELWLNEEKRFRQILKIFNKNDIIVFPQTITFDLNSDDGLKFFKDSLLSYQNSKKMILFLRESKSFEFAKQHMKKIKTDIVPDMVLNYKYSKNDFKRSGVLLCLRKDKEKALTQESVNFILSKICSKFSKENVLLTDTVLSYGLEPDERETEVQNKLKQFEKSSLVVTDRLHGMVFSAITGTPCIALGNSNGKVKNVYEWIKNLNYIVYVDNPLNFETAFDSLKLDENYDYDYEKISKKFEPLKKMIKEFGEKNEK